MGLQKGPKGAKATFRNVFAKAHAQAPKLADVRLAHSRRRSETLAVIDGNVLVMNVPVAIDTFEKYVALIATQVGNALTAAEHVVVVFDEPEFITKAKLATQRRRDRGKKRRTPLCSSDMQACPMDDNYTLEDLTGVRIGDAPEGTPVAYTDGNKEYAKAPANVQLMMGNREARARFHDAVAVGVLQYVKDNIDGNGAWSLSFDGVDARGAERPANAARNVGVLSSDPDFWVPLLARETPIGEGDMKLTDVTAKVHAHATQHPEGPVGAVSLNLLWTIDTDSLLIELIQESRRAQRDGPAPRPGLPGMFAAEASAKRKREDDADGGKRPAAAGFPKHRALSAMLRAYVGETGRTAWCGCATPRPMPIGAKCGVCGRFAFERPPDEQAGSSAAAATEESEEEEEPDAAPEAPEAPEERKREQTVLCLREPARKRTKDHPAREASFLCVDAAKLHHSVLRYIFGAGYDARYDAATQRRAIQLFALGVLMCECDFCEIKGATAAAMLSEVRELARRDDGLLALMDNACTGSSTATLRMCSAAEKLFENYLGLASGVARHHLQAHAWAMRQTATQAVWTLAYWNGYEFKDIHLFGFAAEQSSDLAAAP